MYKKHSKNLVAQMFQALFEPILVTPDEYYAIGFVVILIGLMYTMYQAFQMPDERDDDDQL
jgi:hypothetical protein